MRRIAIYKLLRIYPRLRQLFYIYYNPLCFYIHGVCFGKRMRVFDKVYILGHGSVEIGDDFLFTSGDSLNPICRNIRGAIYTVSPESKVKIGDRVGISSACIWAKDRITIGNDVNIGGDCIIIDNDAHPHDFIQRRSAFCKEVGFIPYLKTIPSAPVVIEDDVWIGARCMILKGVHIGARSIIAAGSVVTKDIPADVIAGGNPCRMIRKINREERIGK